MATHSSVLAWRIPGMGETGGLPSMGSHRVGHDWSDLAAAAAATIALNCFYIITHLILITALEVEFISMPMYRWENRGTERLDNLSKITEQVTLVARWCLAFILAMCSMAVCRIEGPGYGTKWMIWVWVLAQKSQIKSNLSTKQVRLALYNTEASSLICELSGPFNPLYLVSFWSFSSFFFLFWIMNVRQNYQKEEVCLQERAEVFTRLGI